MIRCLGTSTRNGQPVILRREYGPSGHEDETWYILTDFTEKVSLGGFLNSDREEVFWSQPEPMLQRAFVPGQLYWHHGLEKSEWPGTVIDVALQMDQERLTVPAGAFDVVPPKASPSQNSSVARRV